MKAKSGQKKDKSDRLTKSGTAFQLTLNQPDWFNDVREYIESLKDFQYGIACKENAPSTQHVHIHIYVQYRRSVRLSLKNLRGSHIEKCKGSPQQNKDYIEKEGNIIWEKGTMKKKGGVTIEDVKKMKKEDREHLNINLYNIVNKINNEEKKIIKVSDYHKEIEVIYIWGESGSGKSRQAIQILNERKIEEFNEVKCINGFWHGVCENCMTAIYDDFRYSHMSASEFINFIDYNRHTLNIKGGSIRNNYNLIIITSIQNPEDLYPNLVEKDEEPKKQWIRRIKLIIHRELINK